MVVGLLFDVVGYRFVLLLEGRHKELLGLEFAGEC